MSQKTRSYFKGKKTYSGDQNHFMDSIGYKIDPTDTAAETAQGFVKLATDANAKLRANDIGDGFQRVVKPSQIPELELAAGGSHTPGVATEVGALKLTPLAFDDGTDQRTDWMLEVQTGKPTSAPGTADMNVLHIDTADNNGIYLKANGDQFQEHASNYLELKDGGTPITKLETFAGGNLVLVTDASGVIIEGSASDDQVNALASIGASKIAVTGAGGLLEASSLAIAKLDYIDVTPGTSANSKAVVLSAAGKIDAIDITALTLNGTLLASTATELGVLAGVTPGTASAGKAVVLDGSKKISDIDITTLKINGSAITPSAADINLLAGAQSAGVAANDVKLLAGADAAGVDATDIQKIAGAGVAGLTADMMDSNMEMDMFVFHVSFETGYSGTFDIRFPYACNVEHIHASVTKALAGTDDATIRFKDDLGTDLAGTGLSSGELTLTLSSAIGTNFTASPTTFNTFAVGGKLQVYPRKTTVGGECVVTIGVRKLA